MAEVRAWAVAMGVGAAVVGVIALLGGFAPAAGAARPVVAGETVQLARWDLTPQRAEVIDANPDPAVSRPEVRVWFTVVNTSTETLSAPWGLVELVLPDGTTPDVSWRLDGREGGFDPDVPLTAFLRARPETIAWMGDQPITVSIADEELSDTPAPIEVWHTTGVAASGQLPCPDLRR